MRLNPNAGKTWLRKPKRNNNDFLYTAKSRKFFRFFYFLPFDKNNITDYLYQNPGNQIVKIPVKVLPARPN